MHEIARNIKTTKAETFVSFTPVSVSKISPLDVRTLMTLWYYLLYQLFFLIFYWYKIENKQLVKRD